MSRTWDLTFYVLCDRTLAAGVENQDQVMSR